MNAMKSLMFSVACVVVSGTAQAAGESVVVAVCPLTGPGVAACAAVAVGVHEVVKVANGKDAFGNGGEGMKLLHGIGSLLSGDGGGGGKGERVESVRRQQMSR